MYHYFIGQERLCRVLLEHLKRFGVEVEFSSELVSLEQREDHMRASVRKRDVVDVIDVPFVVGADGGRGGSRWRDYWLL